MSNFIGPVLPGHSKNYKSEDDEQQEVIGPALPPGWGEKNDSEEEKEDEDSVIGPVLPPNLMKKRTLDEDKDNLKEKLFDKRNKTNKNFDEDTGKKVIGPSLPPSFSSSSIKYPEARADLPRNKSNSSRNTSNNVTVDSNVEDDSDDDEFTIGPLPPSGNFIEVEESRHQRSQELSKPGISSREEWIASLPQTSTVARKLGFGESMTRFASKPVSSEPIVPVEQDTELAEAVEEYNQITRPESLVDIHKKQSKTKKPEEKQSRSLFDFNPEEDLKVKQMDTQLTKSIMDKAKFLNSRFSNPRGSNKFL